MPGLARRVFHAGAGLLTAHTARKLRQPCQAFAEQDRAWRSLVRAYAGTAYGEAAGLERSLTYAEFRHRIPPQTYEQFIPWIERMKLGEADVLWPGRCSYYAVSSGTTAGPTKYLPVTSAMLAHFRRAGRDSLLYYTARVGRSRVFLGRHLFLGGSTGLAPLPASLPFRAYGGDLSGISAKHLPGWAERFLYEPGMEIARIDDWTAKIAAIVERTWSRDISLIAGIPSWVLVLAERLRARGEARGQRLPNLQALWPQLECLVHGGVPLGPFAAELRSNLGPEVNFHEVYPASEGFIAAQDSDASAGLRLMCDAGIFYEFLPMTEFRETGLADLGPKVVPLEEVRPGVDYALVMSTPAGLSRYVIGDVVRFVSIAPPRLVYVGRTRLQLSAFGEHVIEKEVTDVLTAVGEAQGWHIGNFHVAPLFPDPGAGRQLGRHEWWIELHSGATDAPAGPGIAAALDTRLRQLNDDYAAKRAGGGLEMPVVRLVAPGGFEQWMRQKGRWGGQNKVPRCRSDREIADELAGLANGKDIGHRPELK